MEHRKVSTMIPKSPNSGKKRKMVSDGEGTRSNLSCKSCGHAFAVFLTQMAEHNAKQMAKPNPNVTNHADITCPKCGKTRDYSVGPLTLSPVRTARKRG